MLTGVTVQVPTTWRRDHIVHEVTHVQLGGFKYSFRTACGRYERVDDARAFVAQRCVNCLDCIAGPDPIAGLDTLRGHTADMIYFDEVQDFHGTNPCAEVPLEP